tara:strand:+ start:997 stop:1272 length:276 start_codon:yes stop_codon:yes gene_type:complete
MITQEEVEELVDLAKHSELGDPIDWGLLAITENQAYQMMASSVLEQITELDKDQQTYVAMASMTKLLVENFVLNLKLHGGENVLLKAKNNT